MSVQQSVRSRLGRDYERIPPVMAQTKGVHLEVWESPAKRFVGVEFNTESCFLSDACGRQNGGGGNASHELHEHEQSL